MLHTDKKQYLVTTLPRVVGKQTVAGVISRIGSANRRQWQADLTAVKGQYPPRHVTLLAIKSTKTLEVWAENAQKRYVHVKTYPILAASGRLGPKLREGDRQVPEGLYRIIGLNPNSSYHLSMQLNYPNAFDLKQAQAEGRSQPGSNIFIHGKALSIGCLAMGDTNIEQLFTLVHDVGPANIDVIITPTDPRTAALVVPPGAPAWTASLYRSIEKATAKFR
ncbi:MAG: hypothetical protein CR975_04400 [Gammaproteobacteria bacterium]|nr:MAG: hypothetical protein CR975_04400 [Gammaproteobacteria bacterium]